MARQNKRFSSVSAAALRPFVVRAAQVPCGISIDRRFRLAVLSADIRRSLRRSPAPAFPDGVHFFHGCSFCSLTDFCVPFEASPRLQRSPPSHAAHARAAPRCCPALVAIRSISPAANRWLIVAPPVTCSCPFRFCSMWSRARTPALPVRCIRRWRQLTSGTPFYAWAVGFFRVACEFRISASPCAHLILYHCTPSQVRFSGIFQKKTGKNVRKSRNGLHRCWALRFSRGYFVYQNMCAFDLRQVFFRGI